MRCWTLAALLLAACQEQSKPEGRPAEIAFDGAMAANAAALRTHGERISRVLGCHGCHGDDLQGQEWDNDPKGYGLLWASNLTRAVPVLDDDTPETLAARVLVVEHRAYAEAICWFAEGRLRVEGRRVRLRA